MGIINYFNKNKKEELPLIARVNLVEFQKQREKEIQDREVSILESADYTKRLPTIRLCYVALEKYDSHFSGNYKIGKTIGITNPFRIPKNMSYEDSYKVISYLIDKVEQKYNLEECSEKSIYLVAKILKEYGFEKVESYNQEHSHSIGEYKPLHKINTNLLKKEGIIDLFVVDGDFRLFRKSDLYARSFNWYSKNVTKQEIEDIYKNIGSEYLLQYITSLENEKNL